MDSLCLLCSFCNKNIDHIYAWRVFLLVIVSPSRIQYMFIIHLRRELRTGCASTGPSSKVCVSTLSSIGSSRSIAAGAMACFFGFFTGAGAWPAGMSRLR